MTANRTPIECIIILEVPKVGIYLNLIAQGFNGQDLLRSKSKSSTQLLWIRTPLSAGYKLIYV